MEHLKYDVATARSEENPEGVLHCELVRSGATLLHYVDGDVVRTEKALYLIQSVSMKSDEGSAYTEVVLTGGQHGAYGFGHTEQSYRMFTLLCMNADAPRLVAFLSEMALGGGDTHKELLELIYERALLAASRKQP